MLYIAELSINHLGMLNIAKSMIKAAKNSGADFVKIKIKKVNKYYSQKPKKWREYDFIDYRESLELKNDDIKEMVSYCKEIGILAEKSDRMNFKVIGRTHEQRPLVMLCKVLHSKMASPMNVTNFYLNSIQ